MAQRLPIDDLLDCLSQESDVRSTTVTTGAIEETSTSTPPNSQNHRTLPNSPTLDPKYVKFLSSSSLKKKRKKTAHCKYCHKFTFNREQIENHFKDSELCYNLYLRELRVSCLNGTLVKIFRCVSCSTTGKFQVKRHLECNPICFEFYKRRFNVDSWDSLKNKLINLSRQSFASRSSLRRKLENIQSTNKKKDAKTITQSLNEFRRLTALSNYRLCILCQQYYLDSGAVEVSESDALFTQLDLTNKQFLKRMNRFWVCLPCQSAGKAIEMTTANPILNLVETEGYKILYPGSNNGALNVTISIDNLVLIPNKLQNTYRNMTKIHVLSLYKNIEPTNEFISTLYLNRCAKFALRRLYAELYSGEFSRHQERQLQSVSSIYDDSKIRSSSTWHKSRKKNIFSQFVQYGPSAIFFSLDVNLHNVESKMTSLLCNESVITLGFEGNNYNEFQTNYYLHPHGNSEPCPQDCDKTKLQGGSDSLEAKFIPLFITSLSQKQSCFIEQFLKNKNFSLFSEDYHCGIKFYLSGSARIEGIMWPEESSIFNKNLSTFSLTGQKVGFDHYLHFLQTSILTTVNIPEIQENLGIDFDEAVEIQNLAQKYQMNYTINERFIPLPSYETMFKTTPKIEARLNLSSSNIFLEACKNLLLSLSEEEKMYLTTEEWLQNLSSNTKFNLVDEEKISVEYDGKCISFILEDRLNSLFTKYGCFVGIVHLHNMKIVNVTHPPKANYSLS